MKNYTVETYTTHTYDRGDAERNFSEWLNDKTFDDLQVLSYRVLNGPGTTLIATCLFKEDIPLPPEDD